jgi:hypothetical protein
LRGVVFSCACLYSLFSLFQYHQQQYFFNLINKKLTIASISENATLASALQKFPGADIVAALGVAENKTVEVVPLLNEQQSILQSSQQNKIHQPRISSEEEEKAEEEQEDDTAAPEERVRINQTGYMILLHNHERLQVLRNLRPTEFALFEKYYDSLTTQRFAKPPSRYTTKFQGYEGGLLDMVLRKPIQLQENVEYFNDFVEYELDKAALEMKIKAISLKKATTWRKVKKSLEIINLGDQKLNIGIACWSPGRGEKGKSAAFARSLANPNLSGMTHLIAHPMTGLTLKDYTLLLRLYKNLKVIFEWENGHLRYDLFEKPYLILGVVDIIKRIT